MSEFYEGYRPEEGLESESSEDLLTEVGQRYSEVRNSITNDSVLEGLEDILTAVENNYDNAYNQDDWDKLLKEVREVLTRIEEGDEDAAEAALEDIKLELSTLENNK